MIGVMECAVDVAGCAPNMLREEGSSGEWRGGAWVELMVALRGAWHREGFGVELKGGAWVG